MKNIFVKKPYTKCVGEIIPRPFSKISKLIISLDQSSKVLYSLFLSYAKMRLSKYIETKLQNTHIKLFKNAKIGVELGSLLHFFHFFWRKIFILLYSINWLNFIVWLYLLREILSSVYIPIVCLQGCDVMNFEINLTFLIEPFFQHIQLMFHPCSWNLRKPRRMEMCSGNDYEQYFLEIPAAGKPCGCTAIYLVSCCETINLSTSQFLLCNFFTRSY